jgi:phospholipase C
VASGEKQDVIWLGDAGGYDLSIRIASDVTYFRRVAGCVQPRSGVLWTDSAIANTSQFVPKFSAQGTSSATLRFDYVTPPWWHSPKNWIGVYQRGKKARCQWTRGRLRLCVARRGLRAARES